MKWHNLLPLFLLIGIFLISGCTSQYGSPSASKTQAQNTDVAGTTGNVVEITSSGFSPSTLTIKSGDTVTFVNKDSALHWPASAVHPIHSAYDGTSLSEHCPNGNSFDACHGLAQEESYSFTFNKVGSWNYHDHLNPSHTGKIVVE